MHTVPSSPTGLTAVDSTPVSVGLRWNAAQNTYNLYDIYYRVGSAGTQLLAGSVDGSQNTFTVTGLDPGTSYGFSVFTVSGSREAGDRVISAAPAVSLGATSEYIKSQV